MIDVSSKFNTLRYALAHGILLTKKEIIEKVRNNKVPKGDVLEISRGAGISAAKKTSEILVFCHPLPLDWVEIKFELLEESVEVFAEAKAIWKTGVEMEALTAVSAALLNMYDMLKPLDREIEITNIKLIKKSGGKSDFTDEFKSHLRGAVLVISDSTFAGKREDKSGKIIQNYISKYPVDVNFYEILQDSEDMIANRLIELVDDEKVDLIFTTGGSGLGPKDITPEATRKVIDIEVPGISEAIRIHGKERTPFAMLSREIAGIRKQSLIINLPGSSKGAQESIEALFPGLLHAFYMLWGGGHKNDNPNT